MRTIQLQHPDGSHMMWITPGEAERMELKGDAERITHKRAASTKYRLVGRPEPSTSKVSMPVATISDMRKVAGVQRLAKDREEQDLERLIGFGLIPANTPLPRHGYISSSTLPRATAQQ